MSIIYFANDAALGAGSLLDAIQRAQVGDVVAPDPAAFPLGALIQIPVPNPIEFNKELTLAGRGRRARLISTRYLCLSFTDAELDVEDFEFVGLARVVNGTARFRRCAFYGTEFEQYAILFSASNGVVEDSVVCAARNAGIRSTSSDVVVRRSTVVANVGGPDAYNANAYRPVYEDSIVGAVPSSVGFLAPPPDDYATRAGRLPWENWNLRLAPDSPYAVGGARCAGERDLDGLARGRDDVANPGAARYALGAYEARDDDFFWLGRTVGDENVQTPSFAAPDGWRVLQNGALAPATTAPTGKLAFYASGAFVDAPPEDARLTVASSAVVATSGRATLWGAELGVGARLALGGADAEFARVGPFATLELSGDARVGAFVAEEGATILLSGRDRVLAVDSGTASDAFFRASAGSSGYFAARSGVILLDCAFDAVANCALGAGALDFSATASGPRETRFTQLRRDSTVPTRVERRVGNDWVVVDAAATSADWSATFATSGRAEYRLFDGELFLYDAAWSVSGAQFRVLSVCAPAERPTQNWKATTQMALTTNQLMTGQGATILARIYDAFDEESILVNTGENIASVTYSCYYKSNGLFNETLEPIDGHVDVDAGTDCVLESTQTSDAWTRDAIGYSFVLTPDVRTRALFPRKGEYQIKVEIRLTNGNPIVFHVPFSVDDRAE